MTSPANRKPFAAIKVPGCSQSECRRWPHPLTGCQTTVPNIKEKQVLQLPANR
jgi:hypothetical protein